MISFKQFINETDIESVQDVREFFHREIEPFRKQAKSYGVFFRGTRHTPTPYAKITLPSGKVVDVGIMSVRKDRAPADTNQVIHEVVDEWMKEKFGIAGRSGSVFVVGEESIEIAREYGPVYVTVPQGDFKFIWSPKVYDMLHLDWSPIYAIRRKIDRNDPLTDEDVSAIKDLLSKQGYRTNELPWALDSGNEVMIECENLLMIKLDKSILTELKQVMK